MNVPVKSVCISLRASSLFGQAKRASRERASEGPKGLFPSRPRRSRVLARLVSLAQIGERARRLCMYLNLLPKLRASVVGPSQAITSPKATANSWLTDGPA